jgi:hypothetical protein
MKLSILPLAALLALPAPAQDFLARERWQFGFGLNFHPEVQVESRSGANQYLRYTRKDAGTPSLLASVRVLDLAKSCFSLTGEYQFQHRADVEVTNINGTVAAPGGASTQAFRSHAWAPGVSWDFRRTLDFGFGLQYRFARLENDLAKETYNRPWVNAYLGYTFPARTQVKPFVALRQSAALAHTDNVALSTLGTDAGQKRLLRAMDADAVTSLQVGVRF